EPLELLRALLRRADDAVLLRQGREVLCVARREPLDPGPLGALVVLPDGDEGQVRLDESLERAARHRRGRLDLGEALLVALGLDDVGDPAVSLAPGAGKRRVGAAADPDGRSGFLDGLGIYAHPLEPGEASLEGRRRITPERAHHVDAFADARAALLVGTAAGLELLRILPADSHAKDQAASRERVKRRGDLGRYRWVAQCQEIDAGAEPDPARGGGIRGQESQ